MLRKWSTSHCYNPCLPHLPQVKEQEAARNSYQMLMPLALPAPNMVSQPQGYSQDAGGGTYGAPPAYGAFQGY